MSDTKKTDESGFRELMKPALVGTLSGVFTSAALALVLPLILVRSKDPDSLIVPAALIALYLGALVCGISVRRHGVLPALISGGGFVLCLWLLSLTQSGEESVGFAMKLLGYVCCIAVSLLGAAVGKGRPKRTGEGKKSPTAKLRKQLGRRQ